MRTNLPALLLTLASWPLAAEVSLSGKVADEAGAAVAGVAVVLPGVSDTAWSDASGGFVLTGAQSSALSGSAARGLSLHRSGREVRLLGMQEGTSYQLDAFLPDGRSLVRGLSFAAGRAQLPQGAYQTLFLRVRAGNVPVAGWTGVGVSAARSATSAGVLRFSKSGWLTDTLGVASLSATGLSKTLLLSDPWVPATAPVRSGTLVKVLAKDRSFAMGSNLGTLDFTFVPEGVRHSVRLARDFWMDSTEVTQKLYDSLMSARYGSDYTRPYWAAEYGLGDAFPAYSIHTPGGAILFANARSRAEGLDTVYAYTGRDAVNGSAVLTGLTADLGRNGYRLPTEAEWEYAQRGGTTGDFWWGSDSSAETLDRYVVWAGNAFDKGIGESGFGAHAVASKQANAYGLYDLQGNLSEWTNDRTEYEGFAAGAVTDPTGLATGSSWIIRGGNWGNTGIHLRSSCRTLFTPAYEFYFQGFRTVRNAD